MKAILLSIIAMAVSSAFAQNIFKQPESVFYDVRSNRYFVSNQATGEIVEIDSSGNKRIWNNDMSVMRGLTLFGDRLYAACGEILAGFDLATAQKVFEVHIPGVEILNDVCVDSTGTLYVTCPPKGRLYKVYPQTGKYHIYLSGISRPNGCMFQRSHRRILILNWGNNVVINTVSIDDSTKHGTIQTSLSNLDGADEDNAGRIYLSSWKTNAVYRVDAEISQPPEMMVGGLNGPADISYNRYLDVLCIPNMKANEVILKPMPPTTAGIKPHHQPEQFKLFPNVPNPFNPATQIHYTVFNGGLVTITICNVRGEHIRSLIHATHPPGSHQILWDGLTDTGLAAPSGQYVCRMQTHGEMQSIKLILSR